MSKLAKLFSAIVTLQSSHVLAQDLVNSTPGPCEIAVWTPEKIGDRRRVDAQSRPEDSGTDSAAGNSDDTLASDRKISAREQRAELISKMLDAEGQYDILNSPFILKAAFGRSANIMHIVDRPFVADGDKRNGSSINDCYVEVILRDIYVTKGFSGTAKALGAASAILVPTTLLSFGTSKKRYEGKLTIEFVVRDFRGTKIPIIQSIDTTEKIERLFHKKTSLPNMEGLVKSAFLVASKRVLLKKMKLDRE